MLAFENKHSNFPKNQIKNTENTNKIHHSDFKLISPLRKIDQTKKINQMTHFQKRKKRTLTEKQFFFAQKMCKELDSRFRQFLAHL